jgi:hypothetical protein
MHAILNLDSMYFNSPEDNRLAWEFQPFSGNYVAISKITNALYIGQSQAASKIYFEDKTTDQATNVYDNTGSLLTVATNYQMILRTKIVMPNIMAMCRFIRFYVLAQNIRTYGIRLIIADQFQKDSGLLSVPVSTPSGGEIAIYDQSKYDESFYPIENAGVFRAKIRDGFRGKSCYLEITQSDNDPNFKLMSCLIFAEIETGNFL